MVTNIHFVILLIADTNIFGRYTDILIADTIISATLDTITPNVYWLLFKALRLLFVNIRTILTEELASVGKMWLSGRAEHTHSLTTFAGSTECSTLMNREVP